MIYVYIYDLCLSCDSSCCITVIIKLRFFSTKFYVHGLFKIFYCIYSYTATSSHRLDTLVKRFNYNFILDSINPLNAELNPICYLLALLAHHFLHFGRIRVKSLTLRLLMSYIYMEHLFLMFLDHTQRRSTVGRTPLGE